jgi:hypothetical protein
MAHVDSAAGGRRLRSAPLKEPSPPSPPVLRRPAWPWLAALVTIAVAATVVPSLAVPGLVLTLILGLSLPPGTSDRTRALGRAAVVLAALSSVIGLGRFAVSKAMRGIVESGQSAAAFSALWKLREVVIAEDELRRLAPWDPDGDHVGSAALINGLTGASPLRSGKAIETPLLNYAFRTPVETAIGTAVQVEGYLLIVCLPTTGGNFAARDDEAVQEEQAERRYLAYAWPSDAAKGMSTVFFTDEHERILLLDPPRGAPAPYVGAAHPPACDAALGADGLAWKPWKNKKPRSALPGDPPGAK